MHRKAFTLIELLVVIAIIAILAAILFPVFAAAREKARQTTCASNEKQLGLAFLQYSQDFDETMPAISSDGTGWAGAIYPYVKSVNAFVCPDDPTSAGACCYDTAPQNMTSYAYNGNIGANSAYSIDGATAKMSEPVKTVLLAEIGVLRGGGNQTGGIGGICDLTSSESSNTYRSMAGNGETLTDHNRVPGLAAYDTGYMGELNGVTNTGVNIFTGATGRHVSGANYAFCDGHVKFLNGNLVSSGYVCPSGNVNSMTSNSNQGTALCNNTSWAYEAAGTDGHLPDGTQVMATFSPI